MRRALLLLLALLPALAGASPAGAGEEEEWERPYAALLPIPAPDRYTFPGGAHDDGTDFVAVRVTDAATGRPVRGARLRRFRESLEGRTTSYAPMLAEAAGNADGVAWLALGHEKDGTHWIVDAPGYAARQYFGLPDVRVPLSPGGDATARLLDSRGAPIGGVEVEYYLGCPHGPTLERATTAADGTFTLHGVDTDEGHIWVVAPGCASELSDAHDLLDWGARRPDWILDPAATLRGKVVDGAGKPIAGVVVRADDLTRGPAVRTDAAGTFVLPGFTGENSMKFFHPEAPHRLSPDKDAWLVPRLSDPDPSGPLVVPLGVEDFLWAEKGVATVAIRAAATTDADEIPEFAVRLSRRDGRSFLVTVDGVSDEPLEVEVPPGTYEVSSASPLDPVEVEPTVVAAAQGTVVALTVNVALRPRLVIEGEWPEGIEPVLVVGAEAAPVDTGPDAEPTRLAASEPAVVRVRRSVFPVSAPEGGTRRARVTLPPRHVIRIRGRSSLKGAFLTRPPNENSLDAVVVEDRVETYAAGDLLLEADGEKFRVSLPTEGAVDVVLDPEKDRLPTPPAFDARLHFARPDGSAPSRVRVHTRGMPTPGWTPWGAAGEMYTVGADSPHLAKGPCRVVLDAEGLAVLRAEVMKPGDTTLSWGRCGIWIELEDSGGAPADGVVMVDEDIYRTERAVLALEGLEPGAHRIVVSPTTHRRTAKELRIVLVDGQVKSRKVVLTDR